MLGKLILKGGDVAATVQGLVDDAATLANPAATPVQKAIAAVSIASELGPVSLHDAKALKTLSQKLGQKGIDCLKASKATQKATEGLKGAQQKVEAVGDVNRGVKNARKGTDASPSGSATPGKQVSNPYGSKGKPDHQSKIDELEGRARSEAGEGETVLRERKIQGHDSNRRPDVQIVDQEGKTRKVLEAERRPESSRNQKREQEYNQLGVEQETHKVGDEGKK